MTYYGTLATGAGWMCQEILRVGWIGRLQEGTGGLGPYKFVSNTPGVELVMEAYEGYWRKVPSVKRLVFKSVPEATTRMAMLKRGEVDSRTCWTPRSSGPEARSQFQARLLGGIGPLPRLPRPVDAKSPVA